MNTEVFCFEDLWSLHFTTQNMSNSLNVGTSSWNKIRLENTGTEAFTIGNVGLIKSSI